MEYVSSERKQKLYEYVYRQIENADRRTTGYTHNIHGESYPQRNCFLVLKQHVDEHSSGENIQNRILLLYGLRGTGKTTLLAQL